MNDLSNAVLALGPGAMLGLLALGIVLIYRSTGTINLAHGAVATVGAYAYVDLSGRGVPAALCLVLAVLFSGVVGIVIEIVIMRPLRDASVLTKIIGTTAALIVIQSALNLRYGSSSYFVDGLLPTNSVRLGGSLSIGVDRIFLLFIAIVVAAVLWSVYRWTKFGVATSAVSENPVAAEALGLRVRWVAATNWFIAGALAGLAGALLAPITGLNLVQLSGLVVPALAAALVGSLTSFPLTLVGAIAISVIQSLVASHTDAQGAVTAVPFIAIVAMMFLRGKSISPRGSKGLGLPLVGSGKVRPVPLAIAAAAVLVSVNTWMGLTWVNSLMISFLIGIILLSVVVVTGYAGQISLAQFGLAGVGAWVAANLSSHYGWPFLACLVAGAAAATAIGGILAIPAGRVRGASLAVVTLAFSAAVYATLLSRTESITVEIPSIFGWQLNAILNPRRYLSFVVVVFLVLTLFLANLRRGTIGRRFLAVRGDERAAAAAGIDVRLTKATAFAVSGGIAAVGGILFSFQSPEAVLSQFDVFGSINVVAWSVIGGVGFLVGPLVGMGFTPGGYGTQVMTSIYDGNDSVLALVGGLLLLMMLRIHPDGVASLPQDIAHRLTRRKLRQVDRFPTDADLAPSSVAPELVIRERTDTPLPVTLEVAGVSVQFGGVHALRDVSLVVRPGRIHGLIGPNGAGKTTLIDTISGYTSASSGSVSLGGRSLGGQRPHRRAREGLARSFQNVQLFADLDVLENIRVASDLKHSAPLRELLWPRPPALTRGAAEAIETLELGPYLHRRPDELSHGRRQLVSIARAMAAEPSILMLDEPAAGLSETERDELKVMLRRLAQEHGVGVLLIEHDVRMVFDVSDVVTVLDFGEVLISGPPEIVRKSPEVVRAYLGSHADQEQSTGESEQVLRIDEVKELQS